LVTSRRGAAIVLGALAGALIPFLFGRYWLGFSPVPAAVGGGVMGAALALLTSRRGTAIVLGALAGALIPFVFQAGYALVEGTWFGDGIGRHWLGFSPLPAAGGSGVMGAVLALVTTRWGRPPALVSVGFGLAASCFAFVIMFVAEGPNGGEWGIAPA